MCQTPTVPTELHDGKDNERVHCKAISDFASEMVSFLYGPGKSDSGHRTTLGSTAENLPRRLMSKTGSPTFDSWRKTWNRQRPRSANLCSK